MNPIVAVLAVAAAADLAQRCADLRRWPTGARAVAGAALVVAAAGLALVATPVLDAVDVSAPTLQVGAGMLAILWAFWQFFTWESEPAPEPVAGGLVPGLFPLLLTPPVGVLLLAAGARNGLPLPIVSAAVVAGLLVAVPAGVGGRRPVRRLTASLAALAGIVVMADGVLAV